MRRVKIVIKGKEHLRSIPEKVEEITLEQYCKFLSRLDSKNAELTTLSIFCNLPEQELLKMPAEKYRDLLTYLAWVNKVNYLKAILKAKVKKTVNIFGNSYSYPRKVDEIEIGQKLFIDSIVNRAVKEDKNEHEIFLDVLAVMLMPEVLGEYNEDKLEEFKESLSNEPAIQLIPLVNFFLNKYIALTYSGALSSLVRGLKESWALALKSWISMANFLLSTIWQKATRQNIKK